MAFSRRQVMDTTIDKFVYFYGNLVAEDFMELFLLNGMLRFVLKATSAEEVLRALRGILEQLTAGDTVSSNSAVRN